MKRKTSETFFVVMPMAAAMLAAGFALGQDAPAPPPPPPAIAPQAPERPSPQAVPAPGGETAFMPLLYLDEEDLRGFAELLGATVYRDPSRRNVLLYGPADAIAKIKEFVTRLDVPPAPARNVALTFYLVIPGKEGPAESPKAGQPAMDEIAKLLDTTLGIKQFCVWDTLLVRGRDSGGELTASGFLPSIPDAGADAGPGSFKLKVERIHMLEVDKEAPKIALDGLICGAEMGFVTGGGAGNRPQSISRMDTGLKADMNIREGRMEVVGKISISNKGDSAIVIVSAHLLDD